MTGAGRQRQGPLPDAWRRQRGSGAPVGNSNALKHGMYTKAALEERCALRSLTREIEESLQEIEDG